MGKEIRWSKWVQRDLDQILSYWDQRTGTTKYSDKLTYELIVTAELLSIYPSLGRGTRKQDIFQKIVAKHFFIIYKLYPGHITILRFWDTRQHPRKLKRYF